MKPQMGNSLKEHYGNFSLSEERMKKLEQMEEQYLALLSSKEVSEDSSNENLTKTSSKDSQELGTIQDQEESLENKENTTGIKENTEQESSRNAQKASSSISIKEENESDTISLSRPLKQPRVQGNGRRSIHNLSTRNSAWKLPTIASVAALFLFFFSSFWFGEGQGQLQDQIVAEIAYNHQKALSPEIKTSDFDNVKGYLAKLDFNMNSSSELNSTGDWELLGGRYCTIQNHLAAQLKVKNIKTNEVYTWYQFSLNEKELAQVPQNVEQYKNGLKVKLWLENGIYHGLAGGK